MNTQQKLCAAIMVTLLTVSCAREKKFAITEVTNPSAPGSISPNETAMPDGGVLLSWLEPNNAGLALRFATHHGNTWSSSQTVVVRNNLDKYAEAPPWVLALPSKSFVAVWAEQLPLVQGKKWAGNYLLTAASSDAGKTWSQPAIIHSDRTDGEHSFASLAVEDDNHVAIVWLDARDYSTKHTYRLMSTVIDGSGVVSSEKTIDDDVCTCCPTSLVKTSSGLLAAYRNHTAQEIRDTYTIREQSGTWQTGQPLGKEGWHINGCPVNGPTLARNGNNLVAVWFTGLEKQAMVKAAFSSDGGATFAKPIIVDLPSEKVDVLGRTTAVVLDSGEAFVSWIRRQDSKSQLVVARLRPDKNKISHQVIAEGSTDNLGYPRMQLDGSDALVSWGGAGDAKTIKTSLVVQR